MTANDWKAILVCACVGLVFGMGFFALVTWDADDRHAAEKRDIAACERNGMTPIWVRGNGYMCTRDYFDPKRLP